jgi:hypothetical protein
MSSPQSGHVQGPYIFQFSGFVRAFCQVSERIAGYVLLLDRTYMVNPFPQRLSFCRTYLAQSPGSRGDAQTYMVPGLDMYGLLAYPRVKFVHRICPVLGSGSSSLFRTYSVSWSDMSGSLTPQRADSLWGQ